MTSAIEHRNFMLMLSVESGQMLAQSAGHTPASQDVLEQELLEVKSAWMALAVAGIVRPLAETAGWLADLIASSHDSSDQEREMTRLTLYSFGGALVAHLIDAGIIYPRPIDPQEFTFRVDKIMKLMEEGSDG